MSLEVEWEEKLQSRNYRAGQNIILPECQLQLIPYGSSVTQLCLTLCNPMDCSMPGFLDLHHLPEIAQIHVYWLSDPIQQSHSQSSPFSPAFSLSQHQGLFQWVSSSQNVAKVLELQRQHQPFQWIFRINFLEDWLWSPCRPRDSQEPSPTPQFKSISLWHSAFFTVQLSHP